MDATQMTIHRLTLCPVCGYDLGFPAWDGALPSHEICPSCGIQFGYDDASGVTSEDRRQLYLRWRQNWIDAGMPWWSRSRRPPVGWDPRRQLAKIAS
jgi:hypothetical protein